MPLTVDGVVSGLDTTALIDAILTARTVSIDTLKGRLAEMEKQRDAVAGVNNRMTGISEAFAGFGGVGGLMSYTANTSSTKFTVSADADAVAGSYSLRVFSLATAQTSDSQGFASRTASVLGQGTLNVTVGGVSTAVTIDGTNDSLDELAASLNEVDGLTAYVVNTGSATDPYRLVVQGSDTGAANTVTFDTSGLSGGTIPTFTVRTAAADASIEVQGIAIQSASNHVTDALPGVTIDLLEPNTAAELITVQRDDQAMIDKVKAFVDKYNELVDYYAKETVYNADLGIRGALSGESSTRRAMEDLSLFATRGYTIAGSTFETLSALGITTGRDGKLELDETALGDALDADAEGVATFLTSTDGPLGQMSTRIDALYVDEDNGTLVSKSESIAESIADMQEQIEAAEERFAVHAAILRSQFEAMEMTLGRLQSTQGFIGSLISSTFSSSSSSKSS